MIATRVRPLHWAVFSTREPSHQEVGDGGHTLLNTSILSQAMAKDSKMKCT